MPQGQDSNAIVFFSGAIVGGRVGNSKAPKHCRFGGSPLLFTPTQLDSDGLPFSGFVRSEV